MSKEDSKTIEIKELDLHTLNPKSIDDKKYGSKYIIIGKPRSGKSELLKNIIYTKKHIFPVAQVFCESEEFNEFFVKFMPPLFIQALDVNNMAPFQKWKERQLMCKKYEKYINPWCLTVLDDCTKDSKFLKTPEFKDIYKNGAHYRQMNLMTFQTLVDIPREIKGTYDGVFIFDHPSDNEREKLWKNFGSYVTKRQFNDLMDQLTGDYTCLFINHRCQTGKIEDIYSYYKPDINMVPRSSWRFGCDNYWKFNDERYDPASKQVN